MIALFFRPRRQLAGKRALITGASSGIGRAIAERFAEAGVRQVLVARSGDKLAELVDQLPGEARIVVGDVTDPAVRAAALDAAQTEFGGLDLLVNNAGVGAYGRFVKVDAERLRRLMEVNLFAPAELIRQAAPLLRAGDDPAVVNIGSILGCRGLPFSSEYCASKFALHGLSESIRPELGRIGVELLLVAPGTTATDFKANVVDEQGTPPWTRHGGVPADYVARRTIAALERRRRFIVPNPQGRLMVWVNRLAPHLMDKVMERYG